jgi:hypothetical protein
MERQKEVLNRVLLCLDLCQVSSWRLNFVGNCTYRKDPEAPCMSITSLHAIPGSFVSCWADALLERIQRVHFMHQSVLYAPENGSSFMGYLIVEYPRFFSFHISLPSSRSWFMILKRLTQQTATRAPITPINHKTTRRSQLLKCRDPPVFLLKPCQKPNRPVPF